MDGYPNTDPYSDIDDKDFFKLAFSVAFPPGKQKKTQIKPDHFTLWSDREFQIRFRLQKSTVRFILTLLEEDIQCPTEWNVEISPDQQLLFTLRYFATGTLSSVCNDFIGVDKSLGKQIVGQVCHILAHLRPSIIHFPKCPFEIKKVEDEFYNVARFPRCIGCIGSTHVKLTTTKGGKMGTYKNQNNFYSLKVQIVSDANYKIENIVARWPAVVRDFVIFSNSKLVKQLEDGEMGDNVILGNAAYPLRNYLLTPIATPISEAERKYNEAINETHSLLDKTCEVWKRRFPILSIGIPGTAEWVQCVTVATAVLHNIARNVGEKTPKITIEEYDALKLTQINNNQRHINENDPNQAKMRSLFIEYFSKTYVNS